MVSQNEVSLENFEIEDDQRSLEINVVCSWVSSQNAMSSKSKKSRVAKDDKLGNVISQSFDNVSMAIDRAAEVMAKCFSVIGSKSSHNFGCSGLESNFKDWGLHDFDGKSNV